MSQVNFFMLSRDERLFVEMLRSRRDTLLFDGQVFDSPSPAPLGRGESITSEVVTLGHAALLEGYPLAAGSVGYSFPLFKSPTIEWSRSSVTNGALLPGRIFAKIGWLDSTEHNHLLKAWYRGIERWLKAQLVRLEGGWWVAPEAEAWSRSGGVLAFGPGRSLRKSLQL